MLPATRRLHHECVGKIEGCQSLRGAFMVKVAINYGQAALLWLKAYIVFWIGRPPRINLGRISAGFLEATTDCRLLITDYAWEDRPPAGHITQRCQVLFGFN